MSSSDIVEDAESRTSPSSSSDGPLYELSEIMAQLPIKRGLSKHYDGKSRSFTSLASVKSIEDLPKKAMPFCGRAMVKPCKSYAWGLDGHHNNNKAFSPKATISKKGSSRVSCMSSSLAR
ncbi:OXIDATIVE STRESS 3 [Hibiscus trionum]|nr:OXIDATIVE STRESS 3 [Hibiscus trionum]